MMIITLICAYAVILAFSQFFGVYIFIQVPDCIGPHMYLILLSRDDDFAHARDHPFAYVMPER